MLAKRDAFKAGFLLFCADRAMSGAETSALAQTAASLAEKQAGLGGWAGDKLTGTADLAANAATGLGIAAPILAGAGVGYLAHRAVSPEIDEEDIRNRELIEELRHYARRARERQNARALRTGS